MTDISELQKLPYRQWFPWLHLFRTSGLAVGWPQWGISFLAVAVFWSGAAALEMVFGDPYLTELLPELVTLEVDKSGSPSVGATWWIDPLSPAGYAVNLPWQSVSYPVKQLVWGDVSRWAGSSPETAQVSSWSLLCKLIWAVSVWSLFGTAICRAVVVEIATDRSEGLPQVLRFAFWRWAGAVGAPAIPGVGILILAGGLMLTAWMGRFPWLGSMLLTLGSPLLLGAGVAIAGLTLVILWCWPLMIAAIAVEDCDGFGALSRSVSCLLGRPVMAAWNIAVSAVSGGILIGLAGGLLTFGLLSLSRWCEGSIGTAERWLTVMEWSHVCAQGLLLTFAVSVFWSLVTWNYLLLRQAVDGKPFEDIAPGNEWETGPRDLPVVGIPATDLTSAQRAHLSSDVNAKQVTPLTSSAQDP